MEDRPPPPPRNSSRTLAKAAVAVLVVIAIAGIVLATLRRAPPADAPVAADATQPAPAPMTAPAASAVTGEAEAGPNQVVFAADSAQLTEPAIAKLQRIADTARKDRRELIIAATVEARPDRNQRMELARNRAFAVRGVLETSGVLLARMQIQISEVGLGLVSASQADRIEVSPR